MLCFDASERAITHVIQHLFKLEMPTRGSLLVHVMYLIGSGLASICGYLALLQLFLKVLVWLNNHQCCAL